MKKRLLIMFSITLLCSALMYVNLVSPSSNNAASAKAPVSIVESDTLDITRVNSTQAFYLDYEDTLEAVKDNADLIVVGKVIKQSEYGEVGVKNTIRVTNTIKGKAADEIYVLKSGSLKDNEYILKKGKEYILLLGDQSRSGENTYFIKGGEQGCFLIDGDRLYAKDSVMADELENIIEFGAQEESMNAKSSKNQVDVMLEYLSN
jgi:hypothetical protein